MWALLAIILAGSGFPGSGHLMARSPGHGNLVANHVSPVVVAVWLIHVHSYPSGG